MAFGGGPFGNTAPNGPTDAPNPVSLPPGVVATNLSLGYETGYALTSTGHVYAWGSNSYGQLGNGTAMGGYSQTPVEVCAVDGCVNGNLSDIAAVSAGSDFVLALTSSGQVLAWGNDSPGQLGNGGHFGTASATPVPVCAVGVVPTAPWVGSRPSPPAASSAWP